MNRKLVFGGVSPKAIVALVILAVVAIVIWGPRLIGDPQKAALPERLKGKDVDYTLWCPDCDEEFMIRGTEVDSIPKQGEGPEAKRECPKCKKFVATWGRPEAGEGEIHTP